MTDGRTGGRAGGRTVGRTDGQTEGDRRGTDGRALHIRTWLLKGSDSDSPRSHRVKPPSDPRPPPPGPPRWQFCPSESVRVRPSQSVSMWLSESGRPGHPSESWPTHPPVPTGAVTRQAGPGPPASDRGSSPGPGLGMDSEEPEALGSGGNRTGVSLGRTRKDSEKPAHRLHPSASLMTGGCGRRAGSGGLGHGGLGRSADAAPGGPGGPGLQVPR